MKIRIQKPGEKLVDTDLLILPLTEENEDGHNHEKDDLRQLRKTIAEMQESKEWNPSRGNTSVLIRPREVKAKRAGLIGVGKTAADLDRGSFRAGVMDLIRTLRSFPMGRVTADISRLVDQEDAAGMLFEGLLLGQFDPGLQKSSRPDQREIMEITLVSSLSRKEAEKIARNAEINSSAVNLARELSDAPGNILFPDELVKRARQVAASRKSLKLTVLGEKELQQEGFGCLLAVARGSRHRPSLCVLEHAPAGHKKDPPLLLVGKGVTFDSGGISIKPSLAMEEMRTDKSGACSVLATMQALSDLKTASRVIGIMPLVENLPGGNAQRPGDVITSHNGKTVEVINTDAEGRLILADAISWGIERFRPRAVLDIATLTGACVIALGHYRAGIFSNSEEFCSQVAEAAESGGEKLWRLPLDDEYRESLESRIADIKNTGERWGGAVSAAKFLEEFVGKIPWCHIDMAGMSSFPSGANKGTSPGFGVRTLIELARTHGEN